MESHEILPRSLELARILEQTDDEEVIRNGLNELFETLEADLHTTLHNNPGLVYKHMEKEGCLARVESLSRVLETIETGKTLSISDETESHYANAVIPTPQGIQIAFAEASALGPVRTMVGFGKTIVGFKTENIQVDEIDFNPDDPRGALERKFLCRHVVGDLKPEDIRSVVMRIPRHLIREDLLTEDERNETSTFIFRTFELD